MNDFEIVRGYLGPPVSESSEIVTQPLAHAALDRIEAEVERLTASIEDPGGWASEVERLRRERASLLADKAVWSKLAEDNERLRAWFNEAEGHRDYWKNREKKRTAVLEAEVERLRAALEELAHPTMDAHELAHLDDFHQGDIETARTALGEK